VSELHPLEHDPSRLREVAREVLDAPPFRDHADGPVTDVLRRVRDAVAQLVQTVLDGLQADARLAWVVVAVGTVVLGLVVWRATRGWDTDRAVASVAPDPASRSPDDWRREADEHLAAGRRHDAVRCRYAAIVADLIGQGLVEDRPGRTVRELDAEVQHAAPSVAEAVRDAGRRFEDAWYGHVEVSDADLAALDEVARAVAAPRGRAVPA
jgi:hypothetical protein